MIEVQQIQYVKDTFAEYLGKVDYYSASDIKNFLKSPKMFFYDKYTKVKEENQRHFAIGSAVHEMILEPQLFNSNYLVAPKFDKRTKEGKESFAKFNEMAQGKTILFEDEYAMVLEMAVNVKNNHTFMELLNDSYYEVSCYTIDATTGLSIRLRPDILPKSKSTIVDIKSCIESSPKKFKSDVYSYGYSISAAFYLDFLKRENYVFAAIEKQAPYQSSLYVLNDDMVEYGRQQYRMALDLIKWSIDNNYWCDYVEFEILKESYVLGSLDTALETIQQSELIKILE
jgi:ASC-1-like (ASCH) protein